MRIAYQIAVHARERQFKWIFDALYNAHDLFAIHIDRKTPESTVRAIRDIVANRPNVYATPRLSVIYGEWAMTEMELGAIRFFCENHADWQYFINLSGQDYPLKTREHIVAELSRNPRQNFLHFVHLDTLPSYFRERSARYCIRIGHRLIHTPLPNLKPKNIRFDWFGAAWHVITREFCGWLLKDRTAQDCMRFLRHVHVPHEFLMQTLIMNSPFEDTLNTSFKWYIRWTYGAPHPNILTMAHHDELLGADEFFARKFDEDVDREILCALARHIGAPPVPPPMARAIAQRPP